MTVLAASSVAERMRRKGRVMRWAKMAGGSILIALGAKLAVEKGPLP
jgi:threonine/homoserine/homoserine lactone efflux protein